MPTLGAQAVPASTTVPAGTLAPARGTSTRDASLIGPSRDHPRSTQKLSASSKRVSSSAVTHFVAET